MKNIAENCGQIAEDGWPIQHSPTETAAAAAAAQACAACKFQRRKCSPDCPLAPYFPADRPKNFQNVRRLFGVKNVLKTLRDVEPSNRAAAAECMIFEANCRADDLAGGCYKIIAELQSEITFLEAQQNLVLRQLCIFRETAAVAMDPMSSSYGGAVHPQLIHGFNFDSKPCFSSLLLDCGGTTTIDLGNCEDRFRKEFCNLKGGGRRIKEENGASLSCRSR
ncbi:LOB domain-containing protein 25-like [Momordica charantia]|uniref:LOB domain-containing protein 25-like n=1 Tax=Momordica charantia TaxID=3673 RepID=A0A6J1BR93_MOMCH|nr:LOB domain-containing protein 25-like [Momordica charantia]